MIRLPFHPEFPPLPEPAQALADAARAEARDLADPNHPDRVPGFAMTDPTLAWGLVLSLRSVTQGATTFCEWGAGLGVVAGMAELAGWRAEGLELEPGLVRRGGVMLRGLGLDAALRQGSYKPPGFFESQPALAMADWPAPCRGLFDADVIYAYGWPAEQKALRRFFGDHARPGTWLMLYLGGVQVELWRQPPDASSAASPLR